MKRKLRIGVLTLLVALLLASPVLALSDSLPPKLPGWPPVEEPQAPLPMSSLPANTVLIPEPQPWDMVGTETLTLTGVIANPQNFSSLRVDLDDFHTRITDTTQIAQLTPHADLTINYGGQLYQGEAYTLTVTVQMVEGYKSLNFISIYGDGSSNNFRRYVYVDLTAPAIDVTPASHTISAYDTAADVAIRMYDALGPITVWSTKIGQVGVFNPKRLGFDPVDQTVSHTIKRLNPGLNTIAFWATDAAGHQSERHVIEVYRLHLYMLTVVGEGVTTSPAGPEVEEGTLVTAQINVPKRLQIARVMRNGTDITDALVMKNAFTYSYAFEMNENTTLSVEYKPLSNKDIIPGQDKKNP